MVFREIIREVQMPSALHQVLLFAGRAGRVRSMITLKQSFADQSKPFEKSRRANIGRVDIRSILRIFRAPKACSISAEAASVI